MNPLQITDLQFGYSKDTPVLKGLNLSVPAASIYGFLGPNGAGKSTTIRTLLGLLRPKAGKILLWDKPLHACVPSVYQRIGSLVEAPSFYPQLSALDNLRLIGKYQGINDGKRLTEVLERVGLIAHKDRATHKFSTGMKQRLGLAIAILSRPELLILDEPTNGLDPSGISEIRKLMLQLQQEGTTIFLSSHLLSEVEKVATKVGILRQGKLAFEGSLNDLQRIRSENLQLDLRVSNPHLVKHHFPNSILQPDDKSVRLTIQSEKDTPRILRTLLNAGHDVYEANLLSSPLEELFMQITKTQKNDQGN